MFNPTWSPDGSQSCLSPHSRGVTTSCSLPTPTAPASVPSATTSHSRERTPSGHPPANGSRSSHGRRACGQPGIEGFIAVIHPDGTGERRLATSPGSGEGFRGFQLWAPDTTNRIAYSTGTTTKPEGDAIAVMAVDSGMRLMLSDVRERRASTRAGRPTRLADRVPSGRQRCRRQPQTDRAVCAREHLVQAHSDGRLTARRSSDGHLTVSRSRRSRWPASDRPDRHPIQRDGSRRLQLAASRAVGTVGSVLRGPGMRRGLFR